MWRLQIAVGLISGSFSISDPLANVVSPIWSFLLIFAPVQQVIPGAEAAAEVALFIHKLNLQHERER